MKQLMLFPLMAIIAISISISSCSKSSAGYTPTTCDTSISFSTQVKPLINTYCVGCHSNYSTYSGVYNGKSKIYTEVSSGAMPQGTTLSSAQKDIILCWISNGAKNN